MHHGSCVSDHVSCSRPAVVKILNHLISWYDNGYDDIWNETIMINVMVIGKHLQ
jgi:hypothetical protein